ncbi:MAG TPA: hypothetical protein PLV68_13390, partial [Ilumatobacteraceae bacterium]|nr:hypothetical protein [Ilumatobacteraceae bacterium]
MADDDMLDPEDEQVEDEATEAAPEEIDEDAIDGEGDADFVDIDEEFGGDDDDTGDDDDEDDVGETSGPVRKSVAASDDD